MTLGERIQSYRKKNGLSQEQLAEALGVSRQAVSKWELNDAQPDLDKVLALARLFQVSTDTLLGNESPEPEAAAAVPPRAKRPQWYLLGLIPLGVGLFLMVRGLMSLATIYSFLRMTEQITQQMGPF
ncbi:helix-turn-helix domain-containing protein [Lawsonibacter celer]|jgi:transcriptional regulator with XRE-family HTH domain|uniref:helix-turn-helix domain-containing protein n=1 Tax=Lawsonibacter celer TaxID=2986526 RepID=UPI001648DEA3|nr:helix-turn-helix transcriptional regulator [Lawsonibacter celer]